jgi:hypothetical protein
MHNARRKAEHFNQSIAASLTSAGDAQAGKFSKAWVRMRPRFSC